MNNQPNRTFSCVIPVLSINVNLSFYSTFNVIGGYWLLSITNANTQTELIANLPMVTGLGQFGSVMRQFAYMGIGGCVVVPIATNAPDYPGPDGWDNTHLLLWVP